MKNFTTVTIILVMLVLTSAYVGCKNGEGVVAPSPVDGPPTVLQYAGAAVCTACHISTGTEWAQTGHYTALPDLEASDHVADYCYPCHTVGNDGIIENSGYDDIENQGNFGGVQCESCHGAGNYHAYDRTNALSISLGADMCGACHEGSHHPTYTEWEESGHAIAIDARDNSSHFGTHCLECHSTDYRFADSVPDTATPQDFVYGITCVDCHDPHNGENEYQLRADVVTLCGECHTAGGSVPGQNPHHPHADVYQGTGGYEYPGVDYTSSYHSTFEDGCAACHMWTSPFDALGTGEDAIAGHTFEPRIEACVECHPGATSFDIYGAQTEIQALLDELAAELALATPNDELTLSFERAEFNHHFFDGDGSKGIHNVDYARACLQDSIDDFTPGS